MVGLDIGTASIGYAVTDMSGQLMKFKKKNMWGVRLFEEGETAAKRRGFRSVRRRYNRRKQRIALLQEMFAEEIGKIDPQFFIRLKEAYLWKEDRSITNLHVLFDDADFTDREYYHQYKHIYELRDAMIKSKKKEDLRLVYLAIHHIVKYRGNFLYEGQVFSENAGYLHDNVEKLLQVADEYYETNFATTENIQHVSGILDNRNWSKKEKEEQLKILFKGDKTVGDCYNQIIKAILGYKADFAKIYDLSEEAKYSFAEKEREEINIDFADELANNLFEAMFALYSSITLASILKGEVTISAGMIERYKKHKNYLATLKRLIRKEFPDKYKELFSEKEHKKSRGEVKADKPDMNYATYSQRYIRDDKANENLCKIITKILVAKKDILASKNKDYEYCMTEMENKTFLQLLNTKENGAIPYQLHEKELLAIIEGQTPFYPFLKQVSEKIHKLVTFRVPYYVGPLNGIPDKDKSFDWATRTVTGQKVYPWNFDDIINRDASAEIFIMRMTNKCTYLPKEDVIPKNSLLYSEYEVLSELNKIRVNGKLIKDISLKEKMLEELFANPKHARVSREAFIRWLRSNKYHMLEPVNVEGFQKDGEFASYQKSRADFKKIFKVVNESNRAMIEDVVLWVTLFEDKTILENKIIQAYGGKISLEQIKQIKKLKYKGWSRLSRKLLVGLNYTDKHQEKQTIMSLMRSTNLNLMQIINDKDYGFDTYIEEATLEKLASTSVGDIVSGLATSPAVKKGINQALQVVAELVHVNKGVPKKIFLEFARDHEDSKRTNSRYKKLNAIYKNWVGNADNKEIIKELSDNQKNLDRRALYLYFIQNGKCMYTGEALDITALSTYEVDHIIPRSYIKDDSIDNLALVKKIENQTKGDNLLLSRFIIDTQKPRWNILLEKGLISQKKFKNLTSLIKEDDIKGFVQRQLVETRQIIKHVAQILKQFYPSTDIYAVRASLPSDIRKQYGLPKVREINDYHHAFDAHLAILAGTFIGTCYPYWEDYIDYNEYKQYASERNFAQKQKNGYFAGRFSENHVDKNTGEILWNGKEILEYLHKVYGYKDCFISKKVEEITGEFYKQTLVRKAAKQPIKKGLDTEKYGGYTGETIAYSMVISYKKNGKNVKELIGIPTYVASMAKDNPTAIKSYLINSGYEGYEVLRDKINKFQNIEYQGRFYYLASAKEMQNGYQMVLPVLFQKLIFEIVSGKYKEDDIDGKLLEIYDLLQQKISGSYPGYGIISGKLIEKRNIFVDLEREEKTKVIYEILKITQVNAQNGNLKLLGLNEREGRKNKLSLKIEDLVFIDTSVTGLFERRTKL